jgi:hypothetical protein
VRLGPSPDRSVLVGAAAVRLWDAVAERPTDAGATVTALRATDRAPLTRAVAHGSGLHGFLTLRTAAYEVLVQPSSPRFLPSRRSLTILPPPAAPVRIEASLRPSPAYAAPASSVALRGTVEWLSPRLPARWAVIYGWIAAAATPGTPLRAAWTRADAKGEFALFLRTSPPNSDGIVPALVAVVEIHAAGPPTGALADDDLSDLGLDDGSDADMRALLPLQRTLPPEPVKPGDELSLNRDSYSTTPPGTTRPVQHKVIRLT